MRLRSCHISGFGKFVDVAFDLSAPIVCVKKDNGWGKTTLADFICCMFYGLEGGRTRAVAGNDRLRYEPWSGAKFGGSLIFSYGEKLYRIERFFGKTASGDTARLYDQNNMPCYEFGEKCERLGETLFGVNRESFERTAYLPQGEKETETISQDIRSKLLSLLSSTGENDGGNDAVARLDTAERTLRAKRRPAKGKLDEIDERLAYLQQQAAEYRRLQESVSEWKNEASEDVRRLETVKTELARLTAVVKAQTEQNERAAKRATAKEIEEKLRETEAELARLNGFFGEVEPTTVNTEGLENAVKEFYAVKESAEKLRSKADEAEKRAQEKRGLETKLSVSEKLLEGYETMRGEQKKTTREKRKELKKENRQKRRKYEKASIGVIFSFLVAFIGVLLESTMHAIGLTVFAIGAIGLGVCGIGLLRATPSSGKPQEFFSGEMKTEYLSAKAEVESLRAELAKYPADIEKRAESLKKEYADAEKRLSALEKAICAFLDHFTFEQLYDYRSALSEIKDGSARYTRLLAVQNDCKERLSSLNIPQTAEGDFAEESEEAVGQKRVVCEQEKEDLTARIAGIYARIEAREKQMATLADELTETERLQEEKARLERRLLAIRTARELLIRARHNLASRYLQPVEKRVAEYAKTLGFSLPAKPSFTADGAAVLEDQSALRSSEHYSTGLKDLLWFCVRLALIETLYTKDSPTLILDDPFVNFDDKTTEKAKALVKEISKKYQILYFTCKAERTL